MSEIKTNTNNKPPNTIRINRTISVDLNTGIFALEKQTIPKNRLSYVNIMVVASIYDNYTMFQEDVCVIPKKKYYQFPSEFSLMFNDTKNTFNVFAGFCKLHENSFVYNGKACFNQSGMADTDTFEINKLLLDFNNFDCGTRAKLRMHYNLEFVYV